MKSSVLFLLFFTLAISSFAQHDFSIKPLPKIDFNSGLLKQDSSYMSFLDTQKPNDYLAILSPANKTNKHVKASVYTSKMPIAKPHADMWNMPIAIPDSTVNFAIREKRIEIIQVPENK